MDTTATPLPVDVRASVWHHVWECCVPWLRRWHAAAVPLAVARTRRDVGAVATANAAALRSDTGALFATTFRVQQRVHGCEASATLPLNPHNGHLARAEGQRYTARCHVEYFRAAHRSERVNPHTRTISTYRSETYTLTAPNVAAEVCAVLVHTERELNERGGGAFAFDWLSFTDAKLRAVQSQEGRAAALMWRAAYADVLGAHRVPSWLSVLWTCAPDTADTENV